MSKEEDYELGRMFVLGDGVAQTKDMPKPSIIIEYLELAAKQQHSKASDALSALKKSRHIMHDS